MRNWITIALIAALAAALFAGCGGKNGGGASLSGTVVDGATDTPLSGVRVALGGASAVTGSDGNFMLTGLAVGDAVVTAQLTGYEISSVSVPIAAGANVLSEPIKMARTSGEPPGGQPRTIQGTIVLSGESNASGVIVTLFVGTTQYDQVTTGSDGKYYFWAPVGTYRVRAEKTGFAPTEQQVSVTDLTQVVTLDLTLSRL